MNKIIHFASLGVGTVIAIPLLFAFEYVLAAYLEGSADVTILTVKKEIIHLLVQRFPYY